MIVEINDWRDAKSAANLETPEKRRVVLTPTTESVWADICSLNQKRGLNWTDADALEFEARVLVCKLQFLFLELCSISVVDNCTSSLSRA